MSSQETALMPPDALPRAEAPAVPTPSGPAVQRSLGRQFGWLVLSSIALFGGLPQWLDLIASLTPSSPGGDWVVYRLVLVGGALGAIAIALVLASTWVRLVKNLARADWPA